MTDTGETAGHLQIVVTADGSNTIYNAQVGENYHSRNGALQESMHVFVRSGLEYYLQSHPVNTYNVSILEVGFGTGLNFLLTAASCADKQIGLTYTGIEAYPLSLQMIERTGYSQYVSPAIWDKFISHYRQSFNTSAALTAKCSLQLAALKLMQFETEQQFDVIYFDAFASVNQPEMWNEAAINHTLKFLKPGGVFVTYAITGNLKRIIKAAGLKVEKAPGAPGKREMLRAVKADGSTPPAPTGEASSGVN